MRWMHLGVTAHVIGKTITPAIGPDDLLICLSASGHTGTTIAHAATGRRAGARVAVLTATADSPLASADALQETSVRAYGQPPRQARQPVMARPASTSPRRKQSAGTAGPQPGGRVDGGGSAANEPSPTGSGQGRAGPWLRQHRYRRRPVGQACDEVTAVILGCAQASPEKPSSAARNSPRWTSTRSEPGPPGCARTILARLVQASCRS
jgi:hypothetical protein